MSLNKLFLLTCFMILLAIPVQAAEPVILDIPETIPVSGNLAELSELRAINETLEERLKVAEKEAKLNELQGKAITSNIVIPAPSQLQKESRAIAKPVRVVSIQGVNGKLTATIRTANDTLVTVSQKERFAGGTTEISRSGVVIRSGRSTKTLSFE